MASSTQKFDIAVIGAGEEGSALVRKLTKLGHKVCVSHSGSPEELKALQKETGACPKETHEAGCECDLLILSVPMKDVTNIHKDTFGKCKSGCTIIDTCNYYPSRDGHIKELEEGSMPESEWVSHKIGKPVIKAFNNILAKALENTTKAELTGQKIALPVSGDDSTAKNKVMKLIESMGFEAYDAGSLRDSWRQQPGSPAYCTNLDRNGLEKALSQARRENLSKLRNKAYEKMRSSDKDLDWQSLVKLLRETTMNEPGEHGVRTEKSGEKLGEHGQGMRHGEQQGQERMGQGQMGQGQMGQGQMGQGQMGQGQMGQGQKMGQGQMGQGQMGQGHMQGQERTGQEGQKQWEQGEQQGKQQEQSWGEKIKGAIGLGQQGQQQQQQQRVQEPQ